MPAATKNLVFDWNGTLFDDIHALHASTNRLLELEGHQPVTLDTFRDNYTVPLEDLYRKMGFDQTQVARLMSLENSSFHDSYEAMAETTQLREGARDILIHVRDHKVQSVILSNHIVDPICAQLRRLEIDHLFFEVLAYADRATQFRDMTKGERLRRFMVKHDLSPEHTIIVGDSVEEIHIGREQGFVSVAITGGCASEERLRAENPNYLIHSLHELKPILLAEGFAS
ncbi:MAG: HAD family hydrolase [Pseudomonadota bacterium]|nr:HAD family hydrolase [Pseudomonadota bacterium]